MSGDEQRTASTTHGTVTVDSEDFSPPTEPVAAHYTISGSAGSGGMAEVHIARDQLLGREVALKVLSRRSRATQDRFLLEARVTAQLDHPHIVPVHDLRIDENGSPAFSMKLIRGGTLKDLILAAREGKGPDLPRRLEMFIRVCEAMAYAHERGVVHRDLKPSNIMVAEHGELYVVDWGVARVVGMPDANADTLSEAYGDAVHITRTGAAVGSPAYMSPEQASCAEVTPRSDIYALGLILQELVLLHRANPGLHAGDAMGFAEEGLRTPMLEPPELAAVVDRACARRPRDRYASANDLADEIRRYLRGDAVLALPDTRVRAALRWTAQHPNRTASIVGGALAIAIIAVLTAVVSSLQAQHRDAERDRLLHDLTASVARHGHRIDVELLRYRGLLDAFADQAESLWDDGEPGDGRFFDTADFREGRAPADFGPSTAYDGMAVSFTDPLALSATGEPLDDRTRALYPLREDMREAFLRASSEQAPGLSATEQDVLLRDTGVPPAWIYVGLENGVILNYPGMGELGADYDPRKRPWYTSAVATGRGATWGTPYQDASGFAVLVPCNRPLYEDDGTLFGVAGFDVALDTVIGMMSVDVPGAASTWLVDAEGMVVVSSDQAGLNLGAGLHDNQTLPASAFPWPSARDAIIAGQDYGYVAEDGGHVVFVALQSIDWSFAVWVPERR
ncbi:MAG: hypothetical protein EP330_22570 [Deltaproteobacteria bacterium]|nr:MAG: hypothetical protein EP330_22570 [Deltaproteobacteria bacterium]